MVRTRLKQLEEEKRNKKLEQERIAQENIQQWNKQREEERQKKELYLEVWRKKNEAIKNQLYV